ncbi:MAG TPA: GMC family oxidoreductase, partial [Myxococcaceae bacterium]|nr:GMC family oxidoreductase [Myxococcaceae bacterium]
MSAATAGRIYTGRDISQDQVLSCDVCVVGSGAGGAVLAHALVERGLSVVMLEEGSHLTRREFDLREDTAYTRMYQDLGNRTTRGGVINILQGKTLGGSTTVNWCSSFRTPPAILDLWRDRYGAKGLSADALGPHFEALEARLAITEWPEERINRNNRILWDGLGALGYGRQLIKRNVRGCADLGYCGLGCPIDAKQSAAVAFIPEAVAQGLTVFTNAPAVRLETQGRRVRAVHAQLPRNRLTVRAKATAVCAGAINSPALLLRSGLDAGGRVGRRTFLHPTVAMLAVFEEKVNAFYGAPQSVASHHFVERGEGRLGFFLEVPPVHPMLAATLTGGFGAEHQALLGRLAYVNAVIALSVDGFLPWEEGGTVRLGRGGRVELDYPLVAGHFEAFREACKTAARIQFAAGARRVMSLHATPISLKSERDLPLLDAAPWEPLRVRVMSAHVMGGCALGEKADAVVDSAL